MSDGMCLLVSYNDYSTNVVLVLFLLGNSAKHLYTQGFEKILRNKVEMEIWRIICLHVHHSQKSCFHKGWQNFVDLWLWESCIIWYLKCLLKCIYNIFIVFIYLS